MSCPENPTADRVKEYFERVAKDNGIEDLTDPKLADLLSEQDSLKYLRDEFFYPKNKTLPHGFFSFQNLWVTADQSLVDPEKDSIYLAGNSLGLMPKATRKFMEEQFQKWGDMGVFGHTVGPVPWADGDEVARGGVCQLVGANDREVALMNGLTVNIHLLFTAFYRPTESRHKVVIEEMCFPSDHYAVESQIRLIGRNPDESLVILKPREGEFTLRTEDIIDFFDKEGESIAISWLPGVQYYTGQLFDVRGITEVCHRHGILAGWDLAHSIGNVPLELHFWDVDFAAWCSYKYLCTGAGGLAGVFIHERFYDDKRIRPVGWWANKHETRFQMKDKIDLDEGANGYRISNPPITLVAPLLGSLEIFSKVNLCDLRKKSFFLTGYLELLLKEFFSEESPRRTTKNSLKVITPLDHNQRGCQLSLLFSIDIDVVYKELIKRGVAVDKRYPNIIRATPVHLYNNYTDCRRFIDALQEALLAAEISQ